MPILRRRLLPCPKRAFVPLRQLTLRLEAQPAPGDLDRHRAHVAVARVAHSLLAIRLPALEGRRREPGQRADLLAIAELSPAEELHPVQPRAVDADPPQLVQLEHLLEHRIRRRAQQLTPLGLEALDQRVEEVNSLPLPREASLQPSRERRPVPLPQRRQLRRDIPLQIQRQTVVCQEPLHAIGHARAISLRARELPVQVAPILLLERRDPHDAECLLVAAREVTQQ